MHLLVPLITWRVPLLLFRQLGTLPAEQADLHFHIQSNQRAPQGAFQRGLCNLSNAKRSKETLHQQIERTIHCFTGGLFTVQHFLGIRFFGCVYSHFNFNHLQPFPTFPSTLERCWSSWMCMFLAQCSEAKGSPCGEVRFHHGAQAWRYNQPEKTSEIDSCFWIYISFLDLLTEFESQKIPENKKNQQNQ